MGIPNDTTAIFVVQGETAQQQITLLGAMANDMMSFRNPSIFYNQLTDIVELPSGITGAQATQLLFGDTSSLSYIGEVIYSTPSTAQVLLQFMEEAGEELAAVLP